MKINDVLLLISETEKFRFDNVLLIPNALLRAGFGVYLGAIETLAIKDGCVTCVASHLAEECAVGTALPKNNRETYSVENSFQLVWILSNPHPASIYDTYTILWMLSQKVRFVNDPTSMLFLNTKTALNVAVPPNNVPYNYVSNAAEYLEGVVAESDCDWILKPSSEGCGADVFLIRRHDANSRAIIQSMTGNETSKLEMYGRSTVGYTRRYAILQQYVNNVSDNEKRIILAGGRPVCGFRRFIGVNDHRGNVTLANEFSALDLTPEEEQLSFRIGRELLKYGVRFAGIDLAYPFVFELNLANPGGFNYAWRATGRDYSEEAIEWIFLSLRQSHS